jgi:hypothetical protein
MGDVIGKTLAVAVGLESLQSGATEHASRRAPCTAPRAAVEAGEDQPVVGRSAALHPPLGQVGGERGE